MNRSLVIPNMVLTLLSLTHQVTPIPPPSSHSPIRSLPLEVEDGRTTTVWPPKPNDTKQHEGLPLGQALAACSETGSPDETT